MLVSLYRVKLHLRVTSDDEDVTIGIYAMAAEHAALSYIDRKVYATQAELTAAITAAPGAFAAAVLAYNAAIDAAYLLTDEHETREAVRVACLAFDLSRITARQTHDGIVVNDAIVAAILLTTGHLYANRENSVMGVNISTLPNGADSLLMPYRVFA